VIFLPNRSVWYEEGRLVYSYDADCTPTVVNLCSASETQTQQKISHTIIFIIGYILPSVIMMICYSQVITVVCKRLPIGGNSNRAKLRHTIVLILLVTTYVTLWGPFLVYTLRLVFSDFTPLPDLFINGLKLASYSTTVFNPLVYFLSSDIWARFCKRLRGFLPNTKPELSVVNTITTQL